MVQISLLTETSDLQKNASFKPIRSKTNIKEVHLKMSEEVEKANNEFRKYRFRFISELFDAVKIEDDYDTIFDEQVKVLFVI